MTLKDRIGEGLGAVVMAYVGVLDYFAGHLRDHLDRGGKWARTTDYWDEDR